MATKEEGLFPEGYEHLASSLNEMEKQLSRFDTAIDNLPKDRGPRLTFTPPGMGNANGGNRQGTIDHFKQQKDQIRKTFDQYVDQELKNADPKTADRVKTAIDYRLSDNQYKDASRSQLKTQTEKVKSADRSFDFMASLHFNNFDKAPVQEEPKQQSEVAQPQDDKDFTDKFFDRLTSYREQIPDLVEPAIEPGNNTDDVSPNMDD